MSGKIMRPAVFLDRDGTLNVEKDYLIDPAEFEFIDGATDALKNLQAAGFLLVVVTNQSGIGRGYFAPAEVDRLHQHMQKLLAHEGVSLAGIYTCPHHPTAATGEYLCDCRCRKGKPGLLLQAAKDLNIDLADSYMVGDKDIDLLAGQAAGCKTFLVETGYGKRHLDAARQLGVQVVTDLSTAAAQILIETQ